MDGKTKKGKERKGSEKRAGKKRKDKAWPSFSPPPTIVLLYIAGKLVLKLDGISFLRATLLPAIALYAYPSAREPEGEMDAGRSQTTGTACARAQYSATEALPLLIRPSSSASSPSSSYIIYHPRPPPPPTPNPSNTSLLPVYCNVNSENQLLVKIDTYSLPRRR